MKTVVKDVVAIIEYSTERMSWKNAGGRRYHILSYQLTGRYDHTVGERLLRVDAGTLFFINQADAYSVRCVERGRSLCVGFSADTDLLTMTLDVAEDPHVLGIFKRLMAIGGLESEANKCAATARIYELISEIARRSEATYLPSSTRDRVRAAHDYILENYRRRDFDAGALLDIAGVGQKQLAKLFRSEYGASPTQYVIRLRMSAAATLIEEGYMSVSEIAALVGYEDVFYFSRLFKRHFSISPTKYRARSG